jgi:hypothetical protein
MQNNNKLSFAEITANTKEQNDLQKNNNIELKKNLENEKKYELDYFNRIIKINTQPKNYNSWLDKQIDNIDVYGVTEKDLNHLPKPYDYVSDNEEFDDIIYSYNTYRYHVDYLFNKMLQELENNGNKLVLTDDMKNKFITFCYNNTYKSKYY